MELDRVNQLLGELRRHTEEKLVGENTVDGAIMSMKSMFRFVVVIT